MYCRSTVLMLTFLIAGAAHAGEVYRWVDENGRVHYTDRASASAEKLKVKPGSGDAATAAQELERVQKAEKDRNAKATECERQKGLLQSYRSSPKLIESRGPGQERELSAEERKKLIEDTEKAVAANCA